MERVIEMQAQQEKERLLPIAIAEQRDKVIDQGHVQLLKNSKDYKQFLLDLDVYSTQIDELVNRLFESSELDEQARLMAILIELDVRDPSRIGEPLIDTLHHDLQTKAEGEFEFKKGDKNLAKALLQVFDTEDHPVLNLVKELCLEQTQSGIATPFDYRRLTTKFEKDWETASVEDWLDFFNQHSPDQLRESVEVGLSFSSTKPQRYSDQREAWLRQMLRGRCSSLLDIGGSIGVSSKHLMELLSINKACVTDYRTQEQLEACFYGGFERQPGIKYILGEAGDITRHTPDSEQYDLVTVKNVLVHIRDKEKALANILPRINEGGYLLLTGGYNTNPPRKGFWLFRKEQGCFSLINHLPNKLEMLPSTGGRLDLITPFPTSSNEGLSEIDALTIYTKAVSAETLDGFNNIPTVSLLAGDEIQEQRITGLKQTLSVMPEIWHTVPDEDSFPNWKNAIFGIYPKISDRMKASIARASRLLTQAHIPFNRHAHFSATIVGTSASYNSADKQILSPGDQYDLLQDDYAARVAVNIMRDAGTISSAPDFGDLISEDELTARMIEELVHLTTTFPVRSITNDIRAFLTINEVIAALVLDDMGVNHIPDNKKTPYPYVDLAGEIIQSWQDKKGSNLHRKITKTLRALPDFLMNAKVSIKSDRSIFEKSIAHLEKESAKSEKFTELTKSD